MAKERVRIEPKSLLEFKATLDRFAEEVGTDVEMIAREQMRLTCRDAMTFTPPMPKGGGRGLIDAARRAGFNKTGNDISRIFVPMDTPQKGKPVFLRQIINAVKLGSGREGGFGAEWLDVFSNQTANKVRGLTPVLKKIMDDVDPRRAFKKAQNYLNKANIHGSYRPIAGVVADPRAIHERYKNAVNGRWKKNAPIGGPQYYIETKAALDSYILQRQQKVGRVKAGYAAALRQIPKSVSKKGKERQSGVYNAPWVDQNSRSANGAFSQLITPGKVYMFIVNMIGNINNVAKEANTENLVYGNRVRQMEAALNTDFRKALREANKK